MNADFDSPPQSLDHVPWPDELAERYRELRYWSGRNLDEILSDAATTHPNRLAVVSGSRRIGYAALDERVNDLARGLSRLGIEAGERVLVQLPNVLEAVETYFALFRLGAVPIMALPGHRESDISYLVDHASSVAYVCAETLDDFDCAALGRKLSQSASSSLRHVVIVGQSPACSQGSVSYESLLEDGKRVADQSISSPKSSDVALLQLSGGTTGNSKLIPRTHDDYLYSVRCSVERCALDETTVCLIALPLAHNFPLSSPGLLGCLLARATVILAEDTTPDTVFSLLEREKVSFVAAVPPLALTWMQAKKARRLSFPHLNVLQVGGAKLQPEQARELLSVFDCQLQQVFGMAEGLVCYTKLDDDIETITTTQGFPMSCADEVLVVDDHDLPVEPGKSGHLLTRGPYTIRGYFRAPEHNRAAFTKDGFYRSGDIVERRADGAITVVGRAKEQINRGGEKIAPSEVEAHIAKHPQVREAAVVGGADSTLGERIVAFVVPTHSEALTRVDLMAHLRASGLAVYKMPDRIEFVSQLPRTKVGKVDLRALRSEPSVELDSAPGPEASFNLTATLARLMEVAPAELPRNASLLDLGLDSLRLMMLVEELRAHDIEVSFAELAQRPTLADFETIVESARQEAT